MDDRSILADFPKALQTDLMIQTQSHISPVFKELSEGFRRAIISHFHLKIFVPDDYIIHVIL